MSVASTVPAFDIRRAGKRTSLHLAVASLAVVVLAALPFLAYQSTTSSMVTLFVLMALASMWNLLAGFGGMVSIGQQAYIGVGAYTVVLFDNAGFSPYAAILLAGAGAALLAAPTSVLAFRLRGDYFAVGTWVIAEVYRLVVTKFEVLGGGNGKTLTGLSSLDPTMRAATVYWISLALALGSVVVCFTLLRGRVGLALTAIRDDEVGARAGGVDARRVKRIVYLVSAAGCGAAGGVLAVDAVRVQPEAIFSVQWSAYMIVIVIIGGIGRLEGPIVGAVVFFALQQFLADLGTWYLMVLGLLAVGFAIFLPKGLWGAVTRDDYSVFPTSYRIQQHGGGQRT